MEVHQLNPRKGEGTTPASFPPGLRRAGAAVSQQPGGTLRYRLRNATLHTPATPVAQGPSDSELDSDSEAPVLSSVKTCIFCFYFPFYVCRRVGCDKIL